MGPRAGLDDMEKDEFLTLPARSQSLYLLQYPSCLLKWFLWRNFKLGRTDSVWTVSSETLQCECNCPAEVTGEWLPLHTSPVAWISLEGQQRAFMQYSSL
jgi:hypothetical protein